MKSQAEQIVLSLPEKVLCIAADLEKAGATVNHETVTREIYPDRKGTGVIQMHLATAVRRGYLTRKRGEFSLTRSGKVVVGELLDPECGRSRPKSKQHSM